MSLDAAQAVPVTPERIVTPEVMRLVDEGVLGKGYIMVVTKGPGIDELIDAGVLTLNAEDSPWCRMDGPIQSYLRLQDWGRSWTVALRELFPGTEWKFNVTIDQVHLGS